MPADGLALVFAFSDVHRPFHEHRESQSPSRAELQHADAPLNPVAEGHQPGPGELGERPAPLGDLAARERSAEQPNHRDGPSLSAVTGVHLAAFPPGLARASSGPRALSQAMAFQATFTRSVRPTLGDSKAKVNFILPHKASEK
jgi:hypothetical protein